MIDTQEKSRASVSRPSRLTVVAKVVMAIGLLGLLGAVWSAGGQVLRDSKAVRVGGRITGNDSGYVPVPCRLGTCSRPAYYLRFSYETEGGSYDGVWEVPDDSWFKRVPEGTRITVSYLPGRPDQGQPVGDLFGGDHYSIFPIMVRALLQVLFEGTLSIVVLLIGIALLRAARPSLPPLTGFE